MTFDEWYVSANPNHSPRDELLKLAMAAGWHAGRAELTREQMSAESIKQLTQPPIPAALNISGPLFIGKPDAADK